MSTPTPKFQNGDLVRDIVTDYSGVVIATTLWLNGCYRYMVQPRSVNEKTGKPTDDAAFDEHQLELLEARAFQNSAQKETVHKTGGPWPEPQRASDPRR